MTSLALPSSIASAPKQFDAFQRCTPVLAGKHVYVCSDTTCRVAIVLELNCF